MSSGDRFTGGRCTDDKCKRTVILPDMVDEGGWGLSMCPKCGTEYDTCEYAATPGAKFVKNTKPYF